MGLPVEKVFDQIYDAKVYITTICGEPESEIEWIKKAKTALSVAFNKFIVEGCEGKGHEDSMESLLLAMGHGFLALQRFGNEVGLRNRGVAMPPRAVNDFINNFRTWRALSDDVEGLEFMDEGHEKEFWEAMEMVNNSLKKIETQE